MVHSSFKVCWPCQWTVSTDIHRLDQNHILGSSLKNLSSIYMFVMVNIKHPINNIQQWLLRSPLQQTLQFILLKNTIVKLFFLSLLAFHPEKNCIFGQAVYSMEYKSCTDKTTMVKCSYRETPWTIIISLPSLIGAFWHIFPC